MQSKIRLISTDFDGTIHDPSDTPPIAPELLFHLRDAQTCGVKWVINTGRELADMIEKLRLLAGDIRPDFIVAVEREIHQRHNEQYLGHASWNSDCRTDHAALFTQASGALSEIRTWV